MSFSQSTLGAARHLSRTAQTGALRCARSGLASAAGARAMSTGTLFPSVELLLHRNNISLEQAKTIPATGPNGRLLKGDVLAFMGQISKETPKAIAEYLDSKSHMDLSHIELRENKPVVGKQEEKPAKPAYVAPVVSKEFLYELDAKLIPELIAKAERDAYKKPEVVSDLTDPLFEDIISPKVDRFTIKYELDKAILKVDLTLNEKAWDCKEKSAVFFKKLQQLISSA